ncbi:unnamed protein product [Thlaspi arvense]|uniref:Uncharacterized protein n=1 Tax=Thlaspi arvense TaxID=13288 RepID=A0AAU9SS14_THLAR|nr:unnamed protein product [Thlaspi arvense]
MERLYSPAKWAGCKESLRRNGLAVRSLAGDDGVSEMVLQKTLYNLEKEEMTLLMRSFIDRRLHRTKDNEDERKTFWGIQGWCFRITTTHKRLGAAIADLKSTLKFLKMEETDGPEVEDAKKTVADWEKQFLQNPYWNFRISPNHHESLQILLSLAGLNDTRTKDHQDCSGV